MVPRTLLLSVLLLGLVLTATAIRGPFTIDENNYLVTVLGLRQGRLTVPGTEGLPPSRELLFFDPASRSRDVISTPIASSAPPLYAPLAVPFSFLGWRGLVALNTVALLGTIVIVFLHARRFSAGVEAAWLAAIGVGAGSYFYEYGQGLWPHMLAVVLVAGAVYLAAGALEERPSLWAAGAGFLAATATGVRYQNAFVLGCIGIGLFLLARERLRAAAAFALGASVPLAVSSAMNHARLGSWNPISKGPRYLPSPTRLVSASDSFLGDTLTMAWARIVDYSARPPLTGTTHESFLYPYPGSGAYVLVTAVKKAWLQSSPWMIVPLLVLTLAWLPAPAFARIVGPAPQRQLRLLSLVVIPTLGMFSASGIYRTDGLCFNQRYFCELVPLVAVAFAWSVEGVARQRTALLAGGLAGAVLAFASLQPHHLSPVRHYLVMYVPLALAAILAASWGFALAARARGIHAAERAGEPEAFASVVAESTNEPATTAATLEGGRGSARSRAWLALALAVGASLGWAVTVHLRDDVKASRILRQSRQGYLDQLRPHLSDHSAIFATGGIKDALGPLLLEWDVVIAVPGLDRAATTRELLDAFLAQGRRVFFLPNVMPEDLLDEILAGKQVRLLGEPTTLLIEVRAGVDRS